MIEKINEGQRNCATGSDSERHPVRKGAAAAPLLQRKVLDIVLGDDSGVLIGERVCCGLRFGLGLRPDREFRNFAWHIEFDNNAAAIVVQKRTRRKCK